MEVDCDPERLLFDFIRAFPVPQWAAENAYNECHGCHSKLGGKRHNCRLCGQLFCSACTSRYHVPEEFELKRKQGPARICWGCREECLKRIEEYGNRSQASKAATEFHYMTTTRNKQGRLIVHPPEWVALELQSCCFKCREPFKRKRHHCRTCGKIFCPSCSSKIPVPPVYQKKKKTGAARVCDLCRWMIIHGAELSSDPKSSDSVSQESSVSRFVPLVLNVRWDDGTFVAEISDKTGRKTLSDIHKDLLTARPDLQSTQFYYLHQYRPIFEEFWDIFRFKNLAGQLVLRKGNVYETLRPESISHPRLQRVGSKVNIMNGVKELAVALYSYAKPTDPTHLQFAAGDVVLVMRDDNAQWWYGKSQDGAMKGWFPAGFVKVSKDSEVSSPRASPSIGPVSVGSAGPTSSTAYLKQLLNIEREIRRASQIDDVESKAIAPNSPVAKMPELPDLPPLPPS